MILGDLELDLGDLRANFFMDLGLVSNGLGLDFGGVQLDLDDLGLDLVFRVICSWILLI